MISIHQKPQPAPIDFDLYKIGKVFTESVSDLANKTSLP